MSIELLILFAGAMLAAVLGFTDATAGIAGTARAACVCLLVLLVARMCIQGIRKPVV